MCSQDKSGINGVGLRLDAVWCNDTSGSAQVRAGHESGVSDSARLIGIFY